MNYNFRRIQSSDIDSVWSLAENLKMKRQRCPSEIKNKDEILNFEDNPVYFYLYCSGKEN